MSAPKEKEMKSEDKKPKKGNKPRKKPHFDEELQNIVTKATETPDT